MACELAASQRPPPAPPPYILSASRYGSWGWLTLPIHTGCSHLLDAPAELKLRWGAPGAGQLFQHHILKIWDAG